MGNQSCKGQVYESPCKKRTDFMTKNILIPLPEYGFDPTEVSIPWKFLKDAGHSVSFTTPHGRPGQAKPIFECSLEKT